MELRYSYRGERRQLRIQENSQGTAIIDDHRWDSEQTARFLLAGSELHWAEELPPSLRAGKGAGELVAWRITHLDPITGSAVFPDRRRVWDAFVEPIRREVERGEQVRWHGTGALTLPAHLLFRPQE